MPASSTLTFLGTATSVGVPVIGCDCPVCTSDNPRNNRTRSSIVLHTPEHITLVDFGPDLRQQALREKLTHVDSVLITHQHLDHIMGFDDLRAFCWHRENALPFYGGPDTLATLTHMFPWAFADKVYKNYVRPEAHPVTGPFTLADLRITPLPVIHGNVETNGFRFDLPSGHSVAYMSDVKTIPDETRALMINLDVLIIDALRPTPHPNHMSNGEAEEAANQIGAKQTLFTHLTHSLDIDDFNKSLPNNISVAYDGMKLQFPPGQATTIIS